MACPQKYRETSSHFSLCCFVTNVYIFVLDKTAGFGCGHLHFKTPGLRTQLGNMCRK